MPRILRHASWERIKVSEIQLCGRGSVCARHRPGADGRTLPPETDGAIDHETNARLIDPSMVDLRFGEQFVVQLHAFAFRDQSLNMDSAETLFDWVSASLSEASTSRARRPSNHVSRTAA